MSENRASKYILSSKEISELRYEHIAIRTQIRFLVKRLGNLSAQSNSVSAPSTTLNERIGLYRYLLDDFKEAIRRHNDLYERIEKISGVITNEELLIENKEIEQQLDNIIWVACKAVYYRLHEEELNKCASDIIEAVNRICKSIDEHMTKEERVLK